mmetsp:Transcript_28538/g.46839  ORF Transcript_28538/g.46839 Transcript_28538/m.46839 type:complete len:190 (+) Transcript_28538:25-594(+)
MSYPVHIWLTLLLLLSCTPLAVSLRSAPVISSADISRRKPYSKAKVKHPYFAEAKTKRFHHHHYVYLEHGPNSPPNDELSAVDHDHEVKLPTEERYSKLFDLYIDHNKDGVLTANELRSLLHIHKIPTYHHEHDKAMNYALTNLDANRDGIIDKDEYLTYMKRAVQQKSKELLNAEIPVEEIEKLASLI